MSRVPVRFRRAGIIPPSFQVLNEAIHTDGGVDKVIPMDAWNYHAGQYAIMRNKL